MKLLMVCILSMVLTATASLAFAEETMKECGQADGSIVYTNRPKLGCTDILLPELAGVVHNKNYAATPAAPMSSVLREVPVLQSPGLRGAEFRIADSDELTTVCKLYHQWIALQLRTHGGFEHNRVEDTEQRFGYTTIFGSGYPPAGC